MRLLLFVLGSLSLTPPLANAQHTQNPTTVTANNGTPIIFIQPRHRVPNVAQGCCGPATVETVGRHQEYPQVVGWTNSMAALPWNAPVVNPVCGVARPHPCHAWLPKLTRELDRRGVPYQSRADGSYDRTLIDHGLKTGRPVIVGVNGGHRCQAGHYYAVVGRGNGVWHVVNTNRPTVPYITIRNADFRWAGGSILLGR